LALLGRSSHFAVSGIICRYRQRVYPREVGSQAVCEGVLYLRMASRLSHPSSQLVSRRVAAGCLGFCDYRADTPHSYCGCRCFCP
jgi:hypothetical protein